MCGHKNAQHSADKQPQNNTQNEVDTIPLLNDPMHADASLLPRIMQKCLYLLTCIQRYKIFCLIYKLYKLKQHWRS